MICFCLLLEYGYLFILSIYSTMPRHNKYKREIELICETGHWTAEEIYKKLRKSYLFLGIWTVYRNLTDLVNEWMLMRYDQMGERVMYEKAKPPHAHLYCRWGGAIVDVDISQLSFDSIQLPDDFVCEDIQVTFSGYYKDWAPADCRAEIILKQ